VSPIFELSFVYSRSPAFHVHGKTRAHVDSERACGHKTPKVHADTTARFRRRLATKLRLPKPSSRAAPVKYVHLVDRVQMLREGRSANQRVPMHESCYSKLGAAVNKLIPQMTSSTGTKVVVDHPAIDALRRWML